jgi:hypothetical protein
MPGPTWRLNPTDEMLHGAAEALGSSRVIQVLWRFSEPVSPGALDAEWHRLDQGRLSRRAVPARFPGARRKWVPAANAEPLHLTAQPLTDDTAMAWIDAQVGMPLTAGSGALWRLAAAPYADGTLVSLTVPHFRCDGLGVFAAIGFRGHRLAAPRPPLAVRCYGNLRDTDLGDAAAQVAGAVAGAVRVLASPRERGRVTAAIRNRAAAPGVHPGGTTPSNPPVPGSAPRVFSCAFFDIDARRFAERAAAAGGTVNSLFVQIAANLVRARVPRDERTGIDVGIPVSLRESEADERANALVVVPLTVPGGGVTHGDLRQVRRATKELLQATGGHSATLVPEPLWHLLPARWAGALKAPGAQQTDVVASNFGEVPEAVSHFAGSTADRVALRTMNVPGLVPEKARLRASLVLLRSGDLMTLAATGMPDCFGDAASLSRLVTAELAAWGLSARPWWSASAGPVEEPVREDVKEASR